MKIDNPPLPPFRKGGMGGFESYFLSNIKSIIQKKGEKINAAVLSS
jgi:hypothetical protein